MLQQVRVGGCSCVGNGMVRGMVIYDVSLAVCRDKIRLTGLPRKHRGVLAAILETLHRNFTKFRLSEGGVWRYGVDSGAGRGRTRNSEIMRGYQGICSAAQENTKWLSQPRSRSV
ncbi:hypothetical protein C8N30_3699 [Sulfitobacter guttiformis]|uniref:Uncharacterized protein n=1 Tax=Sulfitobacter guttiformis TaxID=74349 RepID=A0A420DK49_9RHOB|nr:hypothetical protein C8N30_3699 [Sulfitobacter guttiformis]